MLKLTNFKKLTSIGLLSSLIAGGFIAETMFMKNAIASSENETSIAQADISNDVVALELVLSVDVSTSVDHEEFELQRNGYIQAFQDPEVQQAIKNLGSEGLVVNMQFWATENVVDIGWFKLIDDGNGGITNLQEFINAMTAVRRNGNRNANNQWFNENKRKKITIDGSTITGSNGTYMGGGTDLKLAIDEAKNLIFSNNYQGRRLVIDMSGDGIPDDTPTGNGNEECGYILDCPPVVQAKNDAVNEGITINGLPINGTNSDQLQDQVDVFYRNSVVGGERAFFVSATFDNFTQAAKRKILGEISNAPVNNAPVALPDEAEVNVSDSSVIIDVLLNDSDVNGDTLTVESVNDVVGGTATIENNKVVFVPGDRSGEYTFSYTVTDNDELEPLTATADITVEVIGFAD